MTGLGRIRCNKSGRDATCMSIADNGNTLPVISLSLGVSSDCYTFVTLRFVHAQAVVVHVVFHFERVFTRVVNQEIRRDDTQTSTSTQMCCAKIVERPPSGDQMAAPIELHQQLEINHHQLYHWHTPLDLVSILGHCGNSPSEPSRKYVHIKDITIFKIF